MNRTRTIPAPRTPLPGLPQPGTWQVLPECSEVGISGRASRLAPTVRAAFSGIRGELLVAEDLDRSQVAIEIDLATLTTGNAAYDEVLVRADPFGITRHPVARFRSNEVRWTGDDVGVTGTLEMAGAASELALSGTYRVDHGDNDGATGAELTARGTVATAVLGRFSLPGASLLVPRRVTLNIRLRARCSCDASAA